MRTSSFLLATLLPCYLATSACGYTPLYAPGEGAADAKNRVQIGTVEMSKVEMNVGERQVAQTVAQRLKLDYPHKAAELDLLKVTIEESTQTLAVERTSTLKRAQISLNGHVELTNPQGRVVLKTNIGTMAAYNVENTPYSTETGKTFAQLTAARTLAEEISRRLALFYRTSGKNPQPLPVPAAPATSPTALWGASIPLKTQLPGSGE